MPVGDRGGQDLTRGGEETITLLCSTVTRSLGIALLSLGIGGTALAAPVSEPGQSTPLDSCTTEAVRREIQSWVCIGNHLVEMSGNEPTRLVPGGERSSPAIETSPSARLQDQDDYDTWCEGGDVCSRRISAFISETKGNGAYGNATGSIGRFDVILKTNLNGRSPRWTISFIHDEGPPLNLENPQVQCFEDVNFFPDSDCGLYPSDQNPRIGPGARRWNSQLLNGVPLEDENDYYGEVYARFTPDGQPPQTILPLRSANFNCPSGRARCTFP